jgi:hypothetical protein
MTSPHPASIQETAFDCPHCGAYAKQFWFSLTATELDNDYPTPNIPGAEFDEKIKADKAIEKKILASLLDWSQKMQSGLVFLEKSDKGKYVYREVNNLHLSSCFNCKKLSVWVHGNLTFPAHREGPLPNPDLPDELSLDFNEARSILNVSPRGAAALLRLCIQKLCAHLGEKGRNIDDDIASLVRKGLSPVVQKSLDVVRVIGNEAVHPGIMDIRDDRETALRLFTLVNLVTDQMISHPKAVNEMYEKLPEGKRKAIERRDAPSGDKS